ncbi:MAG: hypothetical protein ABSH11_12960 [Verrucomicrobiota bacterium]|jgi:hypothetical protein
MKFQNDFSNERTRRKWKLGIIGGRISIFMRLSLAPGFSRVTMEKWEIQPFQRLFGGEKTR